MVCFGELIFFFFFHARHIPATIINAAAATGQFALNPNWCEENKDKFTGDIDPKAAPLTTKKNQFGEVLGTPMVINDEKRVSNMKAVIEEKEKARRETVATEAKAERGAEAKEKR